MTEERKTLVIYSLIHSLIKPSLRAFSIPGPVLVGMEKARFMRVSRKVEDKLARQDRCSNSSSRNMSPPHMLCRRSANI